MSGKMSVGVRNAAKRAENHDQNREHDEGVGPRQAPDGRLRPWDTASVIGRGAASFPKGTIATETVGQPRRNAPGAASSSPYMNGPCPPRESLFTGASSKETKPVYSAYTPPAPKKKKKVERTRFRETARNFRQKGSAPAGVEEVSASVPAKGSRKSAKADATAMKPGKKEKIRYGQAPTKTLPAAAGETKTEDAGGAQEAANGATETENPLESAAKPVQKTRFSARAKEPKQPKVSGPQPDKLAPAAADAADLGILVDRAEGKPVFMASAAGGMEIEQVAAENPDAILKQHIDPGMGLEAFQARKMAFRWD